MKETAPQRRKRLKRIKRPRWNSRRKRRERYWAEKAAQAATETILL